MQLCRMYLVEEKNRSPITEVISCHSIQNGIRHFYYFVCMLGGGRGASCFFFHLHISEVDNYFLFFECMYGNLCIDCTRFYVSGSHAVIL